MPLAKREEVAAQAGTWAGIELKNRLILAPMAGSTEAVFRLICKRMGAAFTVSELCSARGIVYDPNFERNQRYLDFDLAEQPLALQLFGADPEDFRLAITRILEHPRYGAVDLIDINMGCPVDKVVKTGAGSALMRTPDLAARIVETSAETAARYGKKVSVKIRAGWDEASINCHSFAQQMEAAGAAALCLHARTRQQMYSGLARQELFAEVRQGLSIPFAANGDLATCEDLRRIHAAGGADFYMIGRAAQGNPWIFAELLGDGAAAELTAASWEAIVLEHLEGLSQRLGEATAIREFRTELSAYVKGRPAAAQFRREMMQCTERERLEALIHSAASLQFS